MRVGLIGFGSWTRAAYLPALRRDGRASIVSAVAASRSTRERISAELGDGVAVFADFEALLAGPELDAVLIAVPDSLHEATLGAVLDAGKAVLYEPPVSDKRANIPSMLRRLLAAPQITHADIELCYIPAVRRAAELIGRGALGTLQTAGIRLQSSWGPQPGFEISNINHMSTWYVDVLNTLLGTSPRRVMMFDGHGVSGHRQNHSAAYYDYDGVWGHIQANIASLDELEMRVEVNGDDGDMRLDLVSGELRMRTRSAVEWVVESWPAAQPYADFPGMHESVVDFLNAVQSGEPSWASADRVARLHLIGLAADNSRDSGTWAEVQGIDAL